MDKYTIEQIRNAIVDLDYKGRFRWYSIGTSNPMEPTETYNKISKELKCYMDKKEYQKKYYEKNKKKIKDQSKKYYKENSEKIKRRYKKYYEEKKDWINYKKRNYRKKNKGKIKEQNRKYYEENKDKIKKQHKIYHENKIKKVFYKYTKKQIVPKTLEGQREVAFTML